MTADIHKKQRVMWPKPGESSPGGGALFPFAGSVASVEALQRILSDLTRGVLHPGAKLKVRELIERYGISATPLREALAQLAARGLVLVEDRKGFRVPPVSLEQLQDLSQSRVIVEGEALRLAIAHGDAAWEGEVLSNLHQLRREIERRDSASQEWLDAYERQHHRFHKALLAACPLHSLKDFCDNLYIQMTRYRRLLKELGFSAAAGNGAHEPIVEATLARRGDEAVPLLREHITIPVRAIREYLEKNGTGVPLR